MTEKQSTERRTVMDRIFDYPPIYRLKISLVKAVVKPVSALLIRNKFSEEDVILNNVPKGSRVFEIGCGDGNGLRLFVGADHPVAYTGSDYNVHMVDYCRKQYPEARWEEYRGGPYAHATREFDRCVIRHVLHHIPKRADIVLTVREALRISERVVLIEPLQSENAALRMIKSAYWSVTDGGVNYLTLDELHEVLREAGARIEWEIATEPLRQGYACVMSAQPAE